MLVSSVNTGWGGFGSTQFPLRLEPKGSPAVSTGVQGQGSPGNGGYGLTSPLDESGLPGSLSATERHEADLIRLVCSRDKAAFEQLYRLYFRRLTRFLDRVTRRADLIEEILNDVMLVVWNRADTFTHESRVSTWIFAIAYRQALKRVQRRDVRNETVSDPAWVEEDDAASPEAQMILRQSSNRLHAAMERLPMEQRMVVELTYFHGYGYPEIARIMDCPTDTVKTRMFHARRKLRLMLEPR